MHFYKLNLSDKGSCRNTNCKTIATFRLFEVKQQISVSTKELLVCRADQLLRTRPDPQLANVPVRLVQYVTADENL